MDITVNIQVMAHDMAGDVIGHPLCQPRLHHPAKGRPFGKGGVGEKPLHSGPDALDHFHTFERGEILHAVNRIMHEHIEFRERCLFRVRMQGEGDVQLPAPAFQFRHPGFKLVRAGGKQNVSQTQLLRWICAHWIRPKENSSTSMAEPP